MRQIGHYKVPEHTIDIFEHLNRVTTIMGTSGSGKTVIAKNIIKTIAKEISSVILISPTESSNGSFANIVPKPFMHEDLDADLLDNIIKRQRGVTPFYKKANQIDVLRSLYLRHPIPEIDARLRNIEMTIAEMRGRAEAMRESEDKRKKLKDIQETAEDYKIIAYKCGLKKNRDKYRGEKMNEQEKITWQFFDFNPNMLLIIEDSADKFKDRKISPIMREILYKSRHFRMTTIIICQNESDMTPNLRTNSHVTIFTKDEVAMGFFEKSRVPKHLVADYRGMIMNGFFSDYRVMFYFKDEPKDRVRSYKGEIVNSVQIGSRYFHKYCERVVKEDDLDESNPYYAELFGNGELTAF